MFNSTLLDFDLGLLAESPFTEHEKSLEQHVEEDKRMLDNNTSWLEATSDLQAFIDLGSLPEVEPKEEIDCQTVINDVDKLLMNFDSSDELNQSTNDISLSDVDIPAIETFTNEEMAAAEDLLDELLNSSEISLPEPSETEVKEEPKVEVEALNDSGFVDMTNVSKLITEDGQEILIMIAPPSPVPTTSVVAPESVATVDSDESEDWTPDSPRSSKGRPMVKRSPKRTSRKVPYIRDKKERKKQQNVEAARRYRDKKKLEQSEVEVEEQALAEKNKKLRCQLQELEAEVKTMKKLMLELNILKA